MTCEAIKKYYLIKTFKSWKKWKKKRKEKINKMTVAKKEIMKNYWKKKYFLKLFAAKWFFVDFMIFTHNLDFWDFIIWFYGEESHCRSTFLLLGEFSRNFYKFDDIS